MMTIEELLAYFDNGGLIGDDFEVVSSMRFYIQENKRLLFEMNNVWHEDETEITKLFTVLSLFPCYVPRMILHARHTCYYGEKASSPL